MSGLCREGVGCEYPGLRMKKKGVVVGRAWLVLDPLDGAGIIQCTVRMGFVARRRDRKASDLEPEPGRAWFFQRPHGVYKRWRSVVVARCRK